jgi:hypothetical protein
VRRALVTTLNCVVALAALTVITSPAARADYFDDLANSPMSGGRPTAEASKNLKEELLFQRATQVYLCALPLINTLGMKTVAYPANAGQPVPPSSRGGRAKESQS